MDNMTATDTTRNAKYLTKQQLAERLHVSKRTVSRLVNLGRIPAIYHPVFGKGKGRLVYFDWAKVRRALKLPK